MNLEQQLIGLKKELRRSINRQKKYRPLQIELQKLEKQSDSLKEILDGKTIEADKAVQSAKEVSSKFIMQ
jgi:hypothetical protein